MLKLFIKEGMFVLRFHGCYLIDKQTNQEVSCWNGISSKFRVSAEDGTRTRTPVTALPPQSSVYTSFTTSARINAKNIVEGLENQQTGNYFSVFFHC